jgi:hypothetical protein
MQKKAMLTCLLTLLVSIFLAVFCLTVDSQAEESASQATTPITLTKRLSAGWNLISMEVSPAAFQDVEGMCNDINAQAGGCVEIDGWIGGGWSRYICGYLENDFPIQEGSFYFIKCEMPSEWKVSGNVSQLSFSASGSEYKSKADGGSASPVEGVYGIESPYVSLLSQDGTLSGIPGSLTPSLDPALSLYGVTEEIEALGGWVHSSPNVYLFSGTDNVGIGTTSPSAKLEVGNFGDPGNFTGRRDLFQVANHDNNALLISEFGHNHSVMPATVQLGAWHGEQNIAIVTDNLANLQAGSSKKGIFIKSGGNVGIGTMSPETKLTVIGGWPQSSFGDGTGDRVVAGTYQGQALLGAHNNALNAWANLIMQRDGGNVGIGTTSPQGTLELNSARGIIRLFSSNNIIGDDFGYDGGSDYKFWFTHMGPESGETKFRWDNGSSSRDLLVLKNNGNVGIGTSTPSATLDVKGSLRVGGSAGTGTVFSKMEGGTATVGSSDSTLKTVTVTFPAAFSSIPKVIVTARGQDYNDTFSVTTRSISTTRFIVNVSRTNSSSVYPGWGQDLQLDWMAWE